MCVCVFFLSSREHGIGVIIGPRNLFQPIPLHDPFSTIDLNYIFILSSFSTNEQSKTKQFAFTTLFTIQRTTLKVSKNNLP